MTVNGLGHDVYDKLNSGYYAKRPKPRDDYLSVERYAQRKEMFAKSHSRDTGVDVDDSIDEEALEENVDTVVSYSLSNTDLKHRERQEGMAHDGITLGMGIVSNAIHDAVVSGIEHPPYGGDTIEV